MCEIICVTNRRLCKTNFINQMERIAKACPKAIILREKDLNERDYLEIAQQVIEICKRYRTHCILHSFYEIAKKLEHRFIHLPLPVLTNMTEEKRRYFSRLGVSCHSVSEAKLAQKLGATYITAGHVFDTDCKRGTPGRGLSFLTEVCNSVSIPVYAIGGITAKRFPSVLQRGAKGVCIMSSAMQSENVSELFCKFQHSKDDFVNFDEKLPFSNKNFI